MNEAKLIAAYNAAAQAVRTAADAIRNAAEDADLDALNTALDTATTEADDARTALDRFRTLASIEVRYTSETAPAPRESPNKLGMDARTVERYSILRAMNAAASGNWKGAELEREASDAIAERIGREPSGFFVPMDVQERALTVGTAADGGYLVADELNSGSFIDMLTSKMVVAEAGATILSGLQGDVFIPRQTGGASFYWVSESGAPTESKQAFDQVALTPKTGGAFTDISRKLLKQSSIDVERFVMMDLARTCALGIDLAALHGTAANNQPRGIAATSGIGAVVGDTNGAAPTWAHMIALETAVAADNADVGNLAYITNAKVRGKLKSTPIVANESAMIWDRGAGNTPINGYAAHISNQVSSTLTKGNQSLSSAIFFGNWADLIIGQWGTLDLLVDPYTGGTSGTVRVVALQDVDVAVRHAESFSAMLDALT